MTETEKSIDVKTAALAHFKAKMTGELMKYHVPEWGCDIYYRATANMETEARIMSLTQTGKSAAALVESVVLKALDENGRRIFKDSDRTELMMECDPNVLIRIATRLNNANSETVAEIEKN